MDSDEALPTRIRVTVSNGRWRVRDDGTTDPVTEYETKAEALLQSVRLARALAPAVVFVHSPDGTVEQQWTGEELSESGGTPKRGTAPEASLDLP